MIALDAIDVVRAVVRDELAGMRSSSLGIVSALHAHESESDGNNYECDVELRDSGLVLRRVSIATGRVGFVAPPNEGDMVLVQFLEGDLHAPVIVGRLYNDTDRPPLGGAHELVYESVDAPQSGTRRAYLSFPNGNSLELDDDQLVISMGSTTITVANGGDVGIDCSGEVSISSQGGTTISAQGDLSLSAEGAVSITGMEVALEGTSSAKVKGMSTEVSGTNVKIAGMTEFSTG